MNDTNPEIEEFYRRLLMEKTGEERVKMGFSMFQFTVALIADSLKSKQISTDNLQNELFIRIYGDDLDNKYIYRVLEKRGGGHEPERD